MKNILILLIVSALVLTMSCKDESLNPYPALSGGAMVLLDEVTTAVLDVSDITNAKYVANIRDVNGTAASYDLSTYITRGNYVSDTFFVKSYTSFPAEMEISSQEIAGAVDTLKHKTNYDPLDSATYILINSIDGLVAGDKIDFYNNVVDINGQVHTPENVGDDLGNNAGQRSGFEFTTFISCPFVSSDMVGTWTISRDDFVTWIGTDQVEVIDGPEVGQVTFVDLFSHPDAVRDIIMDVDLITAIASVDKQEAWHCDNFGCGFGLGSVEGGGFAFSCSGFVTLDLKHTVALGSFGIFRLELTKN